MAAIQGAGMDTSVEAFHLEDLDKERRRSSPKDD
jgi:hypothetical protein